MTDWFKGDKDKEILKAIFNANSVEPDEARPILKEIRKAGFEVRPVEPFGPEPVAAPLYCALCFYSPLNDDNSANKAETVVRGYAVCYDHMGYLAQGMEFGILLSAVKREMPGPDPATFVDSSTRGPHS